MARGLRGNQLFKAGEYSTAVQAYQVAISLFSAQAVLVPEVSFLCVSSVFTPFSPFYSSFTLFNPTATLPPFTFAPFLTSPPPHLISQVKDLVVTLSSNAAEALLRLGMWQDAKDHAGSALKLDAGHAKSLVSTQTTPTA